MRVRSVKRTAKEESKCRSNTAAGAISLVTQVARKYLKISTDAARKRKQKEGTYPVCSLALSASWASLAAFPTLLLAPGTRHLCFVPIRGVHNFSSWSSSYLPKHCKDPLSFHLSSRHFLIFPFSHPVLSQLPMDDGHLPSGGAEISFPLLSLLFCHKYGQIK